MPTVRSYSDMKSHAFLCHSGGIVMFRKVTYMYKERHDQMLADYIQCHWEQLAEN